MSKAKKQIKKVKALMDKESARSHLKFLKTTNLPYTIKVSNYTTEIESEALGTIQFIKTERSVKMFAAYAKIKSDIKNKKTPIVDKSQLRYFNHDFKKDFFIDEVYNVDLKSAYATVLYNDNFISEKTFQYISSIPKLDRLASVGMLASKKIVFEYGFDNKLNDVSKIVSPTENFFFHCVKRTDEIMNELKFIAYEDYLFTWVDGIYFKPEDEKFLEMEKYLTAINYKFSFEVLKNFSVTVKNKKVKLSFDKNGKTKYFQIPSNDSSFANDILNFLNYKK